MSNQTYFAELAQHHISRLAKQINSAYQETVDERQEINKWEWDNDLDFSILGVIDWYTTQISGIASQIADDGRVRHSDLNDLRQIQFFDKRYFTDWFFSPDNKYHKIKAYVEFLDHLRLAALEYVTHHQNGASSTTDERVTPPSIELQQQALVLEMA